MPPVSVTIFPSDPGNYFLEDNDSPGDNVSRIRFPDGSVVGFEHPTDDLFFFPSASGVNLTLDTVDPFACNVTIGSLTDPTTSPGNVFCQNIETTDNVTIAATLRIKESGNDAAADITAAIVGLQATTGINGLEMLAANLEAKTDTGGIDIVNFSSLIIGGASTDLGGVSVGTSGNLSLTAYGSINFADADSPALESIKGGNTSGNVNLTAVGLGAGIFSTVNKDSVTAPNGNITMTAGGSVSFGTGGANFDNDVRASGSITIETGGSFTIDGNADLASDNFGLATGGNVVITAGGDISITASFGTDASLQATGNAGADVILTTGFGRTFTLTAPFNDALASTSGNVTVNADRILIDPTSGIAAFGGQVILTTAADGRAIKVGSGTDSSTALELSDAELDRVSTPSLFIGDEQSGVLTVVGSISPASAPELTLRSGSNILINSGVNIATTGDLTLRAGGNITFAGSSSATVGGILTAFVDIFDTDPGVGGVGTVGAAFATAIKFVGGLDDDVLKGGAAGDTLDGNAGNDSMFGRAGDDTYVVDQAGDVVTEAVGEGTHDLIKSSITLTLGANIEDLTLTGTAGIDGTGNKLDNIIKGNTKANQILGLNGNDTLQGAKGNDVLNGGSGLDSLDGGADNDTLDGGASNDTLAGGSGADIFQFTAALGGNVDTITDYVVADDSMVLDSAIFSSLVAGALPAGRFVVGAGAVDGNDFIIYNSATGDLFYDADGVGGVAQVRFAHLSAGLALTASEFTVI
jgi:Ca2+-binding RTX toxin-like protein